MGTVDHGPEGGRLSPEREALIRTMWEKRMPAVTSFETMYFQVWDLLNEIDCLRQELALAKQERGILDAVPSHQEGAE